MEKMYAKDYRKKAHEACRPVINKLALIYFVYSLIIGALGGLSIIGVGAIGLLLVVGPMIFSWIMICRKVYAKAEPKVEDLFLGFNRFGEAFVLALLMEIFIALWSLLLVIPGIIKAYAYSMAPYISLDNPGMSATDAITKSREMMKGHKWELFCLEISYIGWGLLCMLTLGILSFWVAPRMEAARYAFYENISGKNVEEAPATEEVAE